MRAAASAASQPAWPAPITMTSYISIQFYNTRLFWVDRMRDV
jgi:hypothetical protein